MSVALYTALGVVVLILLVIAVVTVSIYNQLVSLRRQVDQAKQNIDVLLKQRGEELEKLIDAASEMMEFEEELLTEITELREEAERAKTPTEQANADQKIRGAMADLRARFEEYPELKSQGNVMQFQERVADIETQIADRREFYNDATTKYNIRIQQFPELIFARLFGFDHQELFTATEEAKKDVDVGAAFDEAR